MPLRNELLNKKIYVYSAKEDKAIIGYFKVNDILNGNMDKILSATGYDKWQDGHEIDEALSGEECLNIIKNKEYDLIFMDYMMPDMDGIETLKKIEGFKTPVIALTADAVVGAREKFLKAGFDEYVSKPIIKESLNKSIDNVLNKN